MKNSFTAALGVFLFVLATSDLLAQVGARVQHCNDIEASLTAALPRTEALDFAYVLEKSLAPDIWLSVQKANTDQSLALFHDLPPGLYRVKFSLVDGTAKTLFTSPTLEIKACGDRTTSAGAMRILAQPNPASTTLTVSAPGAPDDSNKVLELLDSRGAIVTSVAFPAPVLTIPVADLPEGIYFLSLRIDGVPAGQERILINRQLQPK